MLGAVTAGLFSSVDSVVGIVINSNVDNYNLRDDLIANHSWDGVSSVNVSVTVGVGITIGSTSASTAAFATGAIPAGSEVTLINNGEIYGRGGEGGAYRYYVHATGYPGQTGGDAIETSCDIIIDNTNGEIKGGGGGGGGGGGRGNCVSGAGGRGQGSQGNAGGGTAGTSGRVSCYVEDATGHTYSHAGDGGDGGAFGSSGVNGSTAWQDEGPGDQCPFDLGPGGGGAGGAGKAVKLNGYTPTWVDQGVLVGAVS